MRSKYNLYTFKQKHFKINKFKTKKQNKRNLKKSKKNFYVKKIPKNYYLR